MVEMKPEYAARLKREQIQNAFLDDMQVVLDRWEAEMRADMDGHIEFTIHSPLYGDYDPDKPMVNFDESALWAGERDITRPGHPISWQHTSLESFVSNNYWHNPEDAIGDIRKYISNTKR